MSNPVTTPSMQPVVLHETKEWLVVNKPAGWHSVSREGDTGESVQSWRARCEPSAIELPESGLCHRLDQTTSGCLLIAKTLAAHERLRTAMGGADGTIQKTYLALMKAGIEKEGNFRLHFEGRYKRSAKTTVSRAGSWETGGRCKWKVLRTIVARGVDVVEVELIGPGRRHQIRAGFAYLEHPLEGDTLYGGPGPANSSLHAWKLIVAGVTVIAPPPPRFVP
ncbi:MAG: RNA pseudouridine synthase [Planctomycetes bacterium]|nr:RNA pseudouridine synthase [Planctomycetota bacterium]